LWYFPALAVCLVLAGCSSSPEKKEARFLKRGQALLASRDYPRAILEFQNAAKAVPKDAEPWYQLGLAFLATGNTTGAAGAFYKATSLNPKHAGAELYLASLMTTSREKTVIEDAENRLKELVESDPANTQALDALAVAKLKLGKPGDASALLDRTLEKFPADLESSVLTAQMKMREKDFAGAEEVLKKAVETAPKSTQAALALGRFYMQTGKIGQSEVQLQRSLQLNPHYAPALYSLGLIQASENHLDQADQTFKQLTTLTNTDYKDYKPVYGLFLFQAGKRDAALAEFQRIAKESPDNREARTRLLTAYVFMDKIPEAEKLLADALKRNSKDSDALLLRSQLRLRTGDLTAAEKDLNQVIGYKPDSAFAHFVLAGVKRKQGLARAERQELLEALNHNPNYLPARLAAARSFIMTKEPKSALEIMDQTPASQKDNVEVLIERNWALLGMENTIEAREGIDRGLRAVRAPGLLLQDGYLKIKQKDYAGALADADEVLTQDPENEVAARLFLESSVARKELPKAVQKMRELASQRPKSAFLQHQLGRTFVASGDRAEGRKLFEAAIALDPKYSAAGLALAELDAAEKHWDSARQHLNAVIASDSRNITALTMAAGIELAAGDNPAAIAKYRSALDVDGSNVLALNNLAYLILIEGDDPNEALRFAQKAVELAPNDAAVRDTLGWIYYRKGIYPSAVEQLKISVAKEATPRREFHLGMSYLKVGDRDLGQRTLKAALKQDPNLAKTEQGW